MNIYDFIRKEQTAYSKPITLEDGWEWSMKEHLRRSFLYLNGQFLQNNSDRKLRPNKNIVLGMMNVQFRTEGFDVKDIELYIDNPDEYYKTPIVRKYHDKWARDNGIDTFIDDMVESYATYGGSLIRNRGEKLPEVVDLRTIAFCSQVDILSNPFGILHKKTESELAKMKNWGKAEYGATMDIPTFMSFCRKQGIDNPEIYEIHGVLPKDWLEDGYRDYSDEEGDYVPQMQVVAYYQDENKQEKGITLYKSKEPELNFKMIKRDKVEGRALGRGGVEELFEPQAWTNWSEVKITEMLEAASKTIQLTDNPQIAKRHPGGLKDLDNLEIIEVTQGTKGLWQADTYPRNAQVFEQALEKWNENAQTLSSAGDALMGETPASGTPFKLYEAQQIEGRGMHKYRQGKLAVFTDEIYRDWVFKHIKKEIVKEQYFLAEFSADELMSLSEAIVKNKVNAQLKKFILGGGMVSGQEEVDFMKQKATQEFLGKGERRFVQILKDEFKDKDIGVKTNIVGKQKNLALMTDKVVNVVRQYLSTPQIRQDPEMTKLLNTILESSGLSPIMFGGGQLQQPQAQQPKQPAKTSATQPLTNITNQNERNT